MRGRPDALDDRWLYDTDDEQDERADDLDLGPPYGLRFTDPGLRGIHLVTCGACTLHAYAAAWPQPAGGVVILPRGDDHLLTSPGATVAATAARVGYRSESAVAAAFRRRPVWCLRVVQRLAGVKLMPSSLS